MPHSKRPRPPLTSADLERLALRYVERYATTRHKLSTYLSRKIRERGWGDEREPEVERVAQRMAELGYVDDAGFAGGRIASLSRRGYGARRVQQALRHAGIERDLAEALTPDIDAEAQASALAWARRRRVGPWAREAADPKLRERQAAAMMRAGHAPQLAWKIVKMAPGEDPEPLLSPD
jgi:regulatory protein